MAFPCSKPSTGQKWSKIFRQSKYFHLERNIVIMLIDSLNTVPRKINWGIPPDFESGELSRLFEREQNLAGISANSIEDKFRC